MMSKILKKITWSAVSGLLAMSAISGHAVSPYWAWGEIEFVQQAGDAFIISLTTDAANGCQHDRIYMYESDLGENAVQRAVSMALAAQASGRQMGVVIDRDMKNSGQRCRALGNMVMR